MNRNTDDLRGNLDGVQSLLEAIGDAMFYGPKDSSLYANGVWAVASIIRESIEKLDRLEAFSQETQSTTTPQNPDWLKNLRIDHKMTQAEVAEQCGIATNHYCNIENGIRRPSPEVAQKLAAILGFSWEKFYPFSPEPTADRSSEGGRAS